MMHEGDVYFHLYRGGEVCDRSVGRSLAKGVCVSRLLEDLPQLRRGTG